MKFKSPNICNFKGYFYLMITLLNFPLLITSTFYSPILFSFTIRILLQSVRVEFTRNHICTFFNINASKCQLQPKAQSGDTDKKKKQKSIIEISDVFRTKYDQQASRVLTGDILRQDGIFSWDSLARTSDLRPQLD